MLRGGCDECEIKPLEHIYCRRRDLYQTLKEMETVNMRKEKANWSCQKFCSEYAECH